MLTRSPPLKLHREGSLIRMKSCNTPDRRQGAEHQSSHTRVVAATCIDQNRHLCDGGLWASVRGRSLRVLQTYRRALEDDVLGGFPVEKGSDLFISVWNLHRWAL